MKGKRRTSRTKGKRTNSKRKISKSKNKNRNSTRMSDSHVIGDEENYDIN